MYEWFDVKLYMNNALLTTVNDALAYQPERCVIISGIRYSVEENAHSCVDKTFQMGLNIDTKCVRAKRLTGINQNGFYKSNTIMAELYFLN